MEEQKQNITEKKRGLLSRFVRYVYKGVTWFLAGFVALFFVLTMLLYVPFVQDWAVGLACRKLSENTGQDVQIGRLRLTPLLDIDLQEVSVKQPTGGSRMLQVKHCVLDLDMTSLLLGSIGVDALDLEEGYVDSQDLIDQLVLQGRLQQFHLDVHDLQYVQQQVRITAVSLDGCEVDIAMRDTTIIDTTTSEPLPWTLHFGQVEIRDSRVAFHTALDTMSVRASIQEATLRQGSFDLGRNRLLLDHLQLKADSLHYDMNYEPMITGLDYNHFALSQIEVSIPKVDYDLEAGHLLGKVDAFSLQEKCGLTLQNLQGEMEFDSTHLIVRDVVLHTPTSAIRAQADMDWDAFTDDGRFSATLAADLSREDVLILTGTYLPAHAKAYYPEKLLTAEVAIEGTMDDASIKACRLTMPGMIDVQVSGDAQHLLDEQQRAASVSFDVRTQNLSLVQKMFDLSGIMLPPMTLTGTAGLQGSLCQTKLLLRQGEGSVRLDGRYNMLNDAYRLHTDIRKLMVSRFVAMSSPSQLSTTIDLNGRGFDLLSGRSLLEGRIQLDEAYIGDSEITDLDLGVKLNRTEGSLVLSSHGSLFDADGCIDVRLRDRQLDSLDFQLDLRQIDFYHLGIVKNPFSASMHLHADGNTNLTDRHSLKGGISAIHLILPDTSYYPKDINLEALLYPDTTYARISAGDLQFRLNAQEGVETLLHSFTTLGDSLKSQISAKDYHRDLLMPLLPHVDFSVQSGTENPLHHIAMTQGYAYKRLDVDLHTHPETGVHGNGLVHSLNVGSLLLDTISFDIHPDTVGFLFEAKVANGPRNPDVTFSSQVHGHITPQLLEASLVYMDEEGRKGVDLGAQLSFHEGVKRLHLTPYRPILAYRYFTVNPDNFLQMNQDGVLEADIDLLADDGTGLKLFSTPNEEAHQDITLSLHRFNVGELCSVMPYMPHITGLLNGDVHFVEDGTTTFMAEMGVSNMAYEGHPMGNLGLSAVYMPNSDGSHFVDGYLTHNDNEVMTFNGTYIGAEEGAPDAVEAAAEFNEFPLELANGFLGETIGLTGHFTGRCDVTGSSSHPRFDGSISTQGMHVLSPLYSIDLRVQDQLIQVVDNRLNLDKVKAFASGSNPMVLDGIINFQELSNINFSLAVKASNFELINASRNRQAAAYGKVFVNMDLRAKGNLSDVDVQGSLDVLGNTDVTYVLMDSPITAEDELSDLVTFCDFGDTTVYEKPLETAPLNLRMRVAVRIDQGTHVNCNLSDDGSNHIRLEGGGNLIMLYDNVKGLQMQGRYLINSGSMTYNYLVLSLHDCKIASGSYVEFNGDIFNPRLNIIASERIYSTVTENKVPRKVAFDVGLTLTQTLDNMGIAFNLDAPEDIAVRNDIAQMTDEQRSRVSITLMATGMYLSENQQGGGFNATDALNAFLQSQISQIAGKALQNVDISLGVHSNQQEAGTQTDYSFRFAKRFWGNRISLIVGGKVSSGNDVQNTGQSIIDNVSIEYRLDKSATRYVHLYYKTNNESVLEGQVSEMGGGLLLRRSTDRLGELFLFRSNKK